MIFPIHWQFFLIFQVSYSTLGNQYLQMTALQYDLHNKLRQSHCKCSNNPDVIFLIDTIVYHEIISWPSDPNSKIHRSQLSWGSYYSSFNLPDKTVFFSLQKYNRVHKWFFISIISRHTMNWSYTVHKYSIIASAAVLTWWTLRTVQGNHILDRLPDLFLSSEHPTNNNNTVKRFMIQTNTLYPKPNPKLQLSLVPCCRKCATVIKINHFIGVLRGKYASFFLDVHHPETFKFTPAASFGEMKMLYWQVINGNVNNQVSI